MPVQTHEVRELVDFAPEGFLVTSFFLDVNAKELPSPDQIQTSADSLLHTAEAQREEVAGELSHDARESLRQDLQKIERFVKEDFQRQDSNGLALYSCSSHDFWEVIELPTPVDNRVVFAPRPYVAPIATFLSHNKPTAILLTDKQNGRIFTMQAGEVKEWTDFEDFVPQRSDQGGWSQMRFQRRSDEWAKHHIDRAAELALRLLQNDPFDWLILGTEAQYEGELMDSLHPYLKDRVIGTIHVRVDAPAAEVIEKASQVREQAEAALIDRLMQQIQEYAGAGGRGTVGLNDTLQALNEQKVHILLVQEGYSEPGAECPNCGLLMAEQPGTPWVTCPACNEPARRLENVIDAAIQKAMESGSTVEVATEYNKLEPIQCIGSVMYY
jgi:peptide subunit release factor 1 (eRF1)